MRHDPDPTMSRVLKATGGAAGLAKVTGVTRQAVHKWKRIPVEHADKVAEAACIPKTELRPDIWKEVSTQG